jgi:CDP-glucose 4,6-dehydratase
VSAEPDATTTLVWRPTRAFWVDRTVAVTGATGFVGSHVVEQLVSLDASVVILQRDEIPQSPISEAWHGRVSVVRGRLEDLSVVERLLGEYSVATVFHLAAQSQVGVANRNPYGTFEANIRGTWTLLEAARLTPTVGQVVVASSDKAYGTQPALPYTEDMPLRAVHPYDVSKACADMLAVSYAHSFGVPVTITRCGNFFGPGDVNWARLVPGTIRSLLRGERPVIRSDGTDVRDYIDVRDGATAYLQLAEALDADPTLAGEAFNLSLERPLTVLQMVELLQVAAKTSLEPDIRATSSNEIPSQSLSAERAAAVLGWSPSRSLEESLEQTVTWYREYLLGNPGA